MLMTGAIAAASAAEIENSFGQNPAFVESGSQVIVILKVELCGLVIVPLDILLANQRKISLNHCG